MHSRIICRLEIGKSRTNMELAKCKFCPYKTPHVDHLSRHVGAVHEGVKSFKCAHCGFGARERALLEDHRARHHRWDGAAGAWTHRCHVCPYKTPRRQVLVEHINNVHTTIRNGVVEISPPVR